ncbi:MAG: hypothetical protein R3A47_11510, partial [Polyangiales bacterium]
MIHGIDADVRNCSGVNLKNQWSSTVDFFRARGWEEDIHVVRYYDCDSTWNDSARKVSTWNLGNFTRSTSINAIADVLADKIRRTYSNSDKPVRILAHSMGGVIARAMLTRHPDLLVNDVVTFGAPHAGAGWASVCGFLPCPTQFEQLKPQSSFLKSLAENPQGEGGTEWTLIGSHDDNTVPALSAVAMDAKNQVLYYTDSDVEHDRYFDNTSDTTNAHCAYSFNTPGSTESRSCKWPLSIT